MKPTVRGMRACLLASVLALAAVAASGCMWGYVREAGTGAGISGARVVYSDANGNVGYTTTDPSGRFVFDANAPGGAPAEGPITIMVSGAGFDPVIENSNAHFGDNFWDIHNFDLNRRAGAQLAADIAITDIYGQNLPNGKAFVTIKNNGPDTLQAAPILLGCPAIRVPKDGGPRENIPPVIQTLPMTAAPGQTADFDTKIALDTANNWYVVGCIAVGLFNDSDESNNILVDRIP